MSALPASLIRANEVRRERSRLRHDLAGGTVSLAGVLSHPAVASATVYDVLTWQRWWGRQRTLRQLATVGVSERRPCGQLTDRQRALLCEADV